LAPILQCVYHRKASNERGNHSRFDVPSFFNQISIPLSTLHRVYFAAPRNSIYFVCNDFRTVRVTLSGFESSRNKVETFVQVLQGISFYNVHSPDPKTHLFAYKNLTYFSNQEQGWNTCDVIKEYVRQGLFDSSEWKVRALLGPSFSLGRELIARCGCFVCRCWRTRSTDSPTRTRATSCCPR
jgi:hypothetical protein